MGESAKNYRAPFKRDVFDVRSLLDERASQQGDTRLQTMCWSPNGKMLAVGMRDGNIHLLDTEKGFIHRAVWNPNIDLIALASKKGEICVRRYFWKRGWKRDVFDVRSLLDERASQQGDTRLQTMCWSPNGKMLAVGMRDGNIHLLDTEKGFVRYSIKLKNAVCHMRWESLPYVVHDLNDDQTAGLVGELTRGLDKMNERTTENDHVKNLKEFCERAAFDSVVSTVMLVADEENVVHILAAGVLPVASIEPPSKCFVNSDPYSISVGDLIYSKRSERLYVVYSSMAQADSSSTSGQRAYGINTQIIQFDIDTLGCFKDGSIWKIAYRWLHLYYSLSYISETFTQMTVDWEEQSAAFESAFGAYGTEGGTNSPECSLADCLLNVILNGHSNAELLNFFRNSLTPAEWKKMNDWVDKGFSQLLERINGDLLCAAEMLQHHMKQFPVSDPFGVAIDTSSNSSTPHEENSKTAPAELDRLAEPIADADCERETPDHRTEYSFDKVKQYFGRFDQLKHPLDLSNNEWSTPELAHLVNGSRGSMTLSQCIRECVGTLDIIRAQILAKFSAIVETKSNVFLETLHSEGFEKFTFFPMDAPSAEYENDDAKKYMERINEEEPVGISCIGSEGRRHCIYASSGRLLSQVEYADEDDSETAKQLATPTSVRSGSSKGATKTSRSERRGSSSDSVRAAVNQPLKIDVPPDFEWLGGGVYYALIKVKRSQDEYVHLMKAFIGDKTLFVHEEASCIEHYSSLSLSCSRKLGVTLSECATRVRWFEIGGGDEQDEEEQTMENERNELNERKENIEVSVVSEESSKPTSVYRKRCAKDKQADITTETNATSGSVSLANSGQPRRSNRKRKSQRDQQGH
ncbi:Abnormal embryogenesis protein 30 [Toxocara canis]|uniref:Anaphase-promoting complex subunit 4 n=1 Tax=Toxocara canis TaxID=6265 RepID=A0A0B2V6H7_TOXCA|nr:Abnormal embryogenesis protein 30 [Toxocara canis]